MKGNFSHAQGTRPEDVHTSATQSHEVPTHELSNAAQPNATNKNRVNDDVIQDAMKQLLWPVLLGGVLHITTLYYENTATLVFVVYGIVVLKSALFALAHRMNTQQAMIVGGCASAVTAAIFTVYKAALFFSVPNLFAVVTTPVINGVFGGLLCGLLYLIGRTFGKAIPKKKGGEHSG